MWHNYSQHIVIEMIELDLGFMIEQRVHGRVVNQLRSLVMTTKPSPIETYLTNIAAIHVKLALLQQLADDHFGHDPDAIKLEPPLSLKPRVRRWRCSGPMAVR
ncbi:MAG: hypothetical protein ACYC3N_04830 [Halothiobacillus sp.]